MKVGKRLDEKAVLLLMQRWEFLEKRGALLDSITTLRMVVGAAPTDADLIHVLLHLFLQQRAGIRPFLTTHTKNVLNAGTVTKALLVRRNIFIHLKNTFPKDAIEPYAGLGFYSTYKGVDINGVRTSTDMGDEEGSDTDETPEAPSSVQQSRKLLMTLCQNLATNRFEKTLAKMSREHLSSNTIDLTTPSAKLILNTIHDVKSFYTTDFADAPIDAPCVVVHAFAGNEVRVQVLADELDENSYRDKLQLYEQDVKRFEEQQCNAYLKQHVLGYVVDLMDDPARVAAKVEKVCNASGVGKGVKRKLFMHCDLCDKAMDWERHKKNKWSVFNCKATSKLDKADLDPLIEIYEVNKASADSEDVLAIVTGGPPPNSATDRNVIVAHARLKGLQPKHQKPKIGTIEIARADILQRIKNKNAFFGQTKHHVIFTTQSKLKPQRKCLSVLQGYSYLNKSTYL